MLCWWQQNLHTNNMVLVADHSTMANAPTSFATPLHRGIYEQCKMVVDHTTQSCFKKFPFDWQMDMCCHLLQMQVPTSSLLPAVILLVAPTGGGKSLV
jgi:hypothetical protein